MSSSHRLSPLLAPRSVALVGGSPRQHSVGNAMIHCLRNGGFEGEITVVNPRYDTVEELPCVPSIAELASPPDLAILSVAAHRMEQTMKQAIEAGARSAVVFDPCFFEGDTQPLLLDRLKHMAREADFPVCGGNGMGFVNYDSRTFASFVKPRSMVPGNIAAFCHSGSVFGFLAFADPRFRFNLLTSQGQEIGASVAEYIDYALDQPTTRVIALFLEAVREPDRFVAALDKARWLNVPVVATKVGRTAASAALATTHSGAMVGDDGAFDAVCRHYGVLRTDDIDTLLSSAQILSMTNQLGPGKLAAVLDSGGLREQLIDLAHDIGVDFAELEASTVEKLRERLAYGLAPVNPVDAAGPLNDDYEPAIVDTMHLLDADPNVAMLVHELYATDEGGAHAQQVWEAAKQMPIHSDKPYVVTYSQGTVRNANLASELCDAGVPLINGVRPLLTGIRNAFAYRDYKNRPPSSPPGVESSVVSAWQARLREAQQVDEAQALSMLSDFGVPAVECSTAASLDEARNAARRIGYPLALKTAVPGITHKSDVGGVHLHIESEDALLDAYESLSELGPQVTVARMASPAGVEIALGMVRDPQYGPIVMVAGGGVLIELLEDRLFMLPPFGVEQARDALETLTVWKLLQGVRGRPACDVDALCNALSRFSVLCTNLGDCIGEMDVNPMIVDENGVAAVDCVVALQ